MFCGHVTLRRLLKFILRIYSIQVTQPLIKFLTGLEIILKIAQDWEGKLIRINFILEK